jgi:GNAT superfamily N-acetyltransferase
VRVVPYEPRLRESLFDLMEAVWGTRLDPDEFEWWFSRNPTGESLISLAEEDGCIVGVAAMSPFRMLLRGEPVTVAIPVHVATHPSYRGRGVFSLLERANEERAAASGSPLTVTFPNAASHGIFTGQLGWTDLPARRLWARVLRPLGALRYMLRGETGSPPDSLPPRGDAPAAGPVRIEPVERFGSEADHLGRRAAAGYGSHVVRDAAFLNWRYADSPRDYRSFAAYRGDRLEGIAVVGHTQRHGVSAGFLADLVAPPDSAAATRSLLRRALAEVRGHADVLIALPPPAPRLRSAFLSVGFLPTPRRIRFIGKPLGPDVRLDPDARAWHFTLGDFDFF